MAKVVISLRQHKLLLVSQQLLHGAPKKRNTLILYTDNNFNFIDRHSISYQKNRDRSSEFKVEIRLFSGGFGLVCVHLPI